MTTCITVMGTGLALRGPDGSMVRAVEGMYKQRAIVFRRGTGPKKGIKKDITNKDSMSMNTCEYSTPFFKNSPKSSQGGGFNKSLTSRSSVFFFKKKHFETSILSGFSTLTLPNRSLQGPSAPASCHVVLALR